MSLAYTGGENFFLKNLTMYSGIQLTEVITSTFQMKSQVKRNAASEKKVLKINYNYILIQYLMEPQNSKRA